MTKKEHQVTQKPRGWERCRLGNHTTSLTPQLPPVKSSHLPTVTSHSSSLPWAPYLALEGDELGVKASKREVSKVRAPRHCGEALGAQVHAFGRAPPSSQRMVAVLGALGLLLSWAWAGIQGPRGQRLPGKKEEVGGAEPKERAGQQAGQQSLPPHLSLGVSSVRLPLTHGSSSLFKIIAAYTGAKERVRQGLGPAGAPSTPTYSCPGPPPVFFVLSAPKPPSLSVHHTGPAAGLLPRVVILHQARNQLVRQLGAGGTPEAGAHLRLQAPGRLIRKKGPRSANRGGGLYHLLDPLEALAMEAKGLFKQHLVLYRPLIREWGEVGQVSQRLLYVVFMPQEHAQCLAQERGGLRLSCPQHGAVSSPNPCGTEAHLLNVVTVLLLGHRNVLVNCRGGRSQLLEEGLQLLTQACPTRGMPPGTRPLTLSPRAGVEPTCLSL